MAAESNAANKAHNRSRPPRSWRGLRVVRAWGVLVTALIVGPAVAAPAGGAGSLSISEKSFRCMTEMTHIGHFYVDNLVGNLKGTVQAAESTTGGVYPSGSVLQLVPTEVMVKREKGFNVATHDWEFFELDVSPKRINDPETRFCGSRQPFRWQLFHVSRPSSSAMGSGL